MKLTHPRKLDPSGQEEADDPVSSWVESISAAWARGAIGTLELAQLVAQARAALKYGQWSQLWRAEGVPFSKRKGEMLVVIGKAVEGLDAQNSAHLPVAWNTLYYLARLCHDLLKRMILAGRVHPDLSLREARALFTEFVPGRRRRRSRIQPKMRLARFAQFVRAALPSWSPAEREFVHLQLLKLAAEIGAARAQVPTSTANRGVQPFEQGTTLHPSRADFSRTQMFCTNDRPSL